MGLELGWIMDRVRLDLDWSLIVVNLQSLRVKTRFHVKLRYIELHFFGRIKVAVKIRVTVKLYWSGLRLTKLKPGQKNAENGKYT